MTVVTWHQITRLNRGKSKKILLEPLGERVPDWPKSRSQGHRSIPENPFVVGVCGFRATLYEGEGGALRGALLPITVFLAVKVIGGAGLALWDRALVGVLLCRGAAEPPVFRFLEEAAV